MRLADKYPFTISFVYSIALIAVAIVALVWHEHATSLLALVLLEIEITREPRKADR